MCGSSRLACLLPLLWACSADDAQVDAGQEAIVFASDFADYESWPAAYHFDPVVDASAPDGAPCTTPHNFSVPRDVFLKPTPSHGASAFPVGTMIVKEARVSPDPATWQVYAMVKRDETYAPGSGCVGWEWFELSLSNGTSEPQIQWRGATPPANAYQGCPSCASCHTSAQNDCVWMIPLESF